MASGASKNKQEAIEHTDGHHRCGYSVYEIEKLPQRVICPYCRCVMKEPYQLTECGHRVCKGCFESRAVEAVNGIMVCPVEDCGVSFSRDQVKNIVLFFCTISNLFLKFMLDRAFKRELDNLPVTCDHKSNGKCTWSGPLKLYQVCLTRKCSFHLRFHIVSSRNIAMQHTFIIRAIYVQNSSVRIKSYPITLAARVLPVSEHVPWASFAPRRW